MKRIFTFIIAFVSILAMTTKAEDVVFNVTVPSPTYQCWIVGNFNGWNNNQYQMTKVDATHYTITIAESAFSDQTVTKATLKYKYLSGGGDWAYVEKDAAGAEISDRSYSASDIVLSWAATYNPNVAPVVADIAVAAYVSKTVTELYVTGSYNGWKSPGSTGTQMTYDAVNSDKDGNYFTATIHTDDAAKLAYKFSCGPSWVYQQKEGDWKLKDVTVKEVFHDSLSFGRIYPGAANLKTVTLNVTVPLGTDSVFMMGSNQGWDGSSWLPGTKLADGSFKFSVSGVDLMEYKYYRKRGWDYEEKQADGTGLSANRSIDAQITVTATDVVAKWSTTALPAINLNDIKVITNQHAITLKGTANRAEIFDITGRSVQSANVPGSFTSKTLNSGVYILRVDGATMKVLVK